MKKSILSYALLFSISFITISCASTKKIEPAPQVAPTVEETPAATTTKEEPLPEEPAVFDDTTQNAPVEKPSEEPVDDTTPLEPVAADEGSFISEPEVVVPQVKQLPEEKKVEEQPKAVEQPKATSTTTPKENEPTKSTPKSVSQTKKIETPKTNASEVKATEIEPKETPAPESQSESSIVSKETITPSRSVSMLMNQYLDVLYPGTGWVYLGETDGSSLLKYFGRKIGTSDTSFSLRSTKPGTTVLHFYKNDVLTGNYIDDYLSVTVADKQSDTADHVAAPSYADYVPPRLSSTNATATAESQTTATTGATSSQRTATAPSTNTSTGTANANSTETSSPSQDDSSVQTVIQTTESSPETTGVTNEAEVSAVPQSATSSTTPTTTLTDTTNLSSDDILSLAQKSFDNKKYADALAYLDSFFDKAVSRVDEGLYLKGQTLEANSQVRNIRSALETYESLVNNYPESIDWQKANDRITYLKRFYFNIR